VQVQVHASSCAPSSFCAFLLKGLVLGAEWCLVLGPLRVSQLGDLLGVPLAPTLVVAVEGGALVPLLVEEWQVPPLVEEWRVPLPVVELLVVVTLVGALPAVEPSEAAQLAAVAEQELGWKEVERWMPEVVAQRVLQRGIVHGLGGGGRWGWWPWWRDKHTTRISFSYWRVNQL
jgi:hypothetical protein